jgi:putative transposase
MNIEDQAKQFADFITVTCLEWKHVLYEDRFKDIVVESLSFLSKSKRVDIYAFVIMSNHFHLIWQMLGDHRREDVQRDFLKYTSQQILKILRNERSVMQQELLVRSKDRKYQVWERNPLSIPLWSGQVIHQKLDYIHNNPVNAGLCKCPWEYIYSSAGFYYNSDKRWSFLKHCDG